MSYSHKEALEELISQEFEALNTPDAEERKYKLHRLASVIKNLGDDEWAAQLRSMAISTMIEDDSRYDEYNNN